MVGTLEELAGLKFGCIYADPPWQYGNQATRAVLPAVGQVKKIDFFVSDVPFDLKPSWAVAARKAGRPLARTPSNYDSLRPFTAH